MQNGVEFCDRNSKFPIKAKSLRNSENAVRIKLPQVSLDVAGISLNRLYIR